MSKLVGQILGDCRIEELLSSGSGGMGQVYRASRLADGAPLAVKVLYQQLADDLKFRARFRDEVKALELIDHPNVVTIYGAGITDDPLYLVMEYVPDGSLQTLLERRNLRPWPLMLGLDLVRQAAAGLAAIHAAGIIHRDIKPSNLLLRLVSDELHAAGAQSAPAELSDERYQLKISDFGIARLSDSSRKTVTRQALGTPRYIAPEQLKDPRSADARSDIYSLGVVLYEIATGAAPLPIQDLADAALHHLVTPIPLPRTLNPELPPELEELIMECLARSPEDRLPSAGALAARLGALLDAEQPGLEGRAAPLSQDPLHIDSSPLIGVFLDHNTLTLLPGQVVELRVTIRNLGKRVDAFTITVAGFPEQWLRLPEPVEVNDRDTAAVTLTIAVPPGAEDTAGEYVTMVCARSGNDESEVGVQPARWVVREVAGGSLAVEPRSARGRSAAVYQVEVYNPGNIAAEYNLRASDDSRSLGYTFARAGAADQEQALRLTPGRRERVELTVTAPRHWLGRDRKHQFVVALEGGGSDAAQSADLVQPSLIPAWVVRTAMLLVALIAFIAFSPPIFWGLSARGIDGAALRDDEPVIVRWRSFNASGPTISPNDVAVPPGGNAFLRWLGLEPWEHTLEQGFSRTTDLSIVASNLFRLNQNSSQPLTVTIQPRAARAGLELEPDEVLYGEPVTATLTLEPATESATLQDGKGKILAEIRRVSPTDKLTHTVVLLLDTATGAVTALDVDSSAVDVQLQKVEPPPSSQLERTYRLLPVNEGIESPGPDEDTVSVVPRVDAFTLEVLGTEQDPTLTMESQAIALSSGAPQEQARLRWSVEGADNVTLVFEDRAQTEQEPGLAPAGTRTFLLSDLTAARNVTFKLEFDGRALGEAAVQITPLVCEIDYDGPDALFLLKSYHNRRDVPVDGVLDLRPSANEGQRRRVIPRAVNPQGDWVEVAPLNVESSPGWLPADTLLCPDENRLRGVRPRELLEPTNTATATPTNTPLPTLTSTLTSTPTPNLAATAEEEARSAGLANATATQIAALTATSFALAQEATQTAIGESNAATQTAVALTMTAIAEQTAAAQTAAAQTAAAQTATALAVAAEAARAQTATALAAPLTVRVTIDRVRALNDMEGIGAGDADFYARVSIADRSFRTGSRGGRNDLRPGDWVFEYQTSLARSSRVPVTIDIWDEDGGGGGDDDHVDLTQREGRTLTLEVNLASCIVSGTVVGSCGASLESSGSSGDRATIWFRIEVLR